MQVACQRQFIESAQLYPAGNCRSFRNPDRSENEGCWFQFFRSSDTIGEAGGFAYLVISPLVRGAGSPCIQSSSQPMLDLALVAVYERDLARALEGVELLTLLRIEHVDRMECDARTARTSALTRETSAGAAVGSFRALQGDWIP